MFESHRTTARRRRRALAGDGAVLAAGLVLPLAFAPYGWYPVAVVSLAVLFRGWARDGSAGRGFWRGWLFGLGAFGFGVSWIHESFQYARVAPGLSAALTAVLVGGLALFPAVLGGLLARAPVASPGPRLALFLPSAWTLWEWLRGVVFTGFTWLQVGYSQTDSPLAGWMPVGGVHLAGLAVALSAGLIAWATARPRPGVALAMASALLVLWGAGAGLATRAWTAPAGSALEAALVQGNVPQDQKWLPAMRVPTLERYARLTARNLDVDLVVWPESALPGYRREFEPFLRGMAQRARAAGAEILLGVPTVAPDGSGALNSVVSLGGAGGVYHKRHLVPFGEYLPLPALLGPVVRWLRVRVADFSAGPQGQPPLRVGGWEAGISVCYEITFGNQIREALPAAAFLVTVSNDAWFGTSIGPSQHLQIARARSLETGRWLLRATNTGITAAVAPDGRVAARAPRARTAVLRARFVPMAGATPFVRVGDAAALLAAGALAALALLLGLPARR